MRIALTPLRSPPAEARPLVWRRPIFHVFGGGAETDARGWRCSEQRAQNRLHGPRHLRSRAGLCFLDVRARPGLAADRGSLPWCPLLFCGSAPAPGGARMGHPGERPVSARQGRRPQRPGGEGERAQDSVRHRPPPEGGSSACVARGPRTGVSRVPGGNCELTRSFGKSWGASISWAHLLSVYYALCSQRKAVGPSGKSLGGARGPCVALETQTA